MVITWKNNFDADVIKLEGRDENISKMDVDGRRQRRPSTRRSTGLKTSVVDVDRAVSSVVDVDQ